MQKNIIQREMLVKLCQRNVLTYDEAEELFSKGFPTFDEMIAAAKRKAGMSDDTKTIFDDIINSTTNK